MKAPREDEWSIEPKKLEEIGSESNLNKSNASNERVQVTSKQLLSSIY